MYATVCYRVRVCLEVFAYRIRDPPSGVGVKSQSISYDQLRVKIEMVLGLARRNTKQQASNQQWRQTSRTMKWLLNTSV